MHTWATIIKDHDENVELEELEDDFTLIVDTETEGNNNKLFIWFCSMRSCPRSRCNRSCPTLSCSCCCCYGNDETSLDDEENDAEAVVDHNNHEVEILQFKIYIFCNQMSLTDIGDG